MDVEAEVEKKPSSTEDESNAEFYSERVSKSMQINNSNLSLQNLKKDNTFEEHVLSAIAEHKKGTVCNDKNCKFHNGQKCMESDSENEGIHYD